MFLTSGASCALVRLVRYPTASPADAPCHLRAGHSHLQGLVLCWAESASIGQLCFGKGACLCFSCLHHHGNIKDGSVG